jgi:hypothetical protein
VAGDELSARRERLLAGPGGGFRPAARWRPVSQALQVYAALATSAATGAVRDLGSFSPMPAHAEGAPAEGGQEQGAPAQGAPAEGPAVR